MSCAPGCRTCEPGRQTSAGNSTLTMRRPPISTPTSNSPTTWKDSSPGSTPTQPPPRCRTASACCGCSSRTSSSTPKRSPSATASPHTPAPAGTTPNPTRRVTMARVIHCVGGVASPLLANIYLHRVDRSWDVREHGVLVRYADDLVVMCHSRAQAEAALAQLTAVLAKLGLQPKAAKTRIVQLAVGGQGFDFLGFHHRLVQSQGRRGRRGVVFLA